MNDGFSFDSANRTFRVVPVAWVNLGNIAGDRSQNLKTTFAHVHEQSEFTYDAYFIAAGHL